MIHVVSGGALSFTLTRRTVLWPCHRCTYHHSLMPTGHYAFTSMSKLQLSILYRENDLILQLRISMVVLVGPIITVHVAGHT